jgi:Leucine-rich repeat (LRR) protein
MRNVCAFLVVLLIGIVAVPSTVVRLQAAIPAEERAALIALYNAANGDFWDKNDGWKGNNNESDGFSQRGSEDSWFGIEVSENRVISIYLGWNNLTGRIPKELGNLNHLQKLILGVNNLSAVPPELGNLTNLTELSLGWNPLNTIPPELENLSNLTTLLLTNTGLVNIPAGLGNLSNLVSLHLGHNNFSGIPPELGNLNNLELLYLSGNNLSEIPPELGNLSNLEQLYLEKNSLTEIPPELGNLGNLTDLYLYENLLTAIPPELGNLHNLTDLRVQKNHLKYFPEAVLTMTNLSHLDLSHNEIRGRIPENFGDLSNLVTLHLDANRLTGPIPLSFLNLTRLKSELISYIRYNGLYSDDPELSDFLSNRFSWWPHFQTIAPANLSASSASFFSIRVSWAPIGYKQHEGGYMVFYGPSANGPWRYAGMTSDKYTSSYEVTGLIPGKTYYFRVKTKTYPNYFNANAVVSEASPVVSAVVSPNSANILGEFDTPVDGAIVRGSIPVSGWVINDTGIESVKIYLEQSKNLVFIGNAVFVEGARPDIEKLFPGFPNTRNAGWGYLMLTNFLPDGGNGIFTLRAIAADKDGNSVTLGIRTIICDNANAVKPFGTIDKPAQGESASGDSFVNFGWVLTPQPNTIPPDGSTITVWVDGVALGHPVYNQYRADIAGLFPGYNNSNGAVGYFYLDTTRYENGVHTIAWSVQDDAGNQDGIGSRYFTIRNVGEDTGPKASPAGHPLEDAGGECRGGPLRPPISEGTIPVDYSRPVRIKKGFNRNIEPQILYPGENGTIHIEIGVLERIEIHLSDIGTGIEELSAGYLQVGSMLRRLPIGSTFDIKTGTFSWQPGPGFIGEYRLVFVNIGKDGITNKKDIVVNIVPDQDAANLRINNNKTKLAVGNWQKTPPNGV